MMKMIMMSLFDKYLFPPPSSLFISAMSIISIISLIKIGLSEIKGNHLQYSKFWNVTSSQEKEKVVKKEIKLSSRTGMLILYTPAFLAGAISFWLCPNHDLRFMLVNSALTIHFLKRDLELFHLQRKHDIQPKHSSRNSRPANRSEASWNPRVFGGNCWKLLPPLPPLKTEDEE